MRVIAIIAIILKGFVVGWLESVGFLVLYELNNMNPILYVVPVHSILGKPPVVPVGDTQAGTILHRIHNTFPVASGDRRSDAGDG